VAARRRSAPILPVPRWRRGLGTTEDLCQIMSFPPVVQHSIPSESASQTHTAESCVPASRTPYRWLVDPPTGQRRSTEGPHSENDVRGAYWPHHSRRSNHQRVGSREWAAGDRRGVSLLTFCEQIIAGGSRNGKEHLVLVFGAEPG
jgi:hypothetical protein